ncbi:MAG: hypothetical protein ACI3XP_07315 [Eubacteriales bacterium]
MEYDGFAKGGVPRFLSLPPGGWRRAGGTQNYILCFHAFLFFPSGSAKTLTLRDKCGIMKLLELAP